ncbi:uncharacterized protein BCR38DRAFT_416713 [Pseudomassariella vexata]|uniref:Uncharacterized protein n=1 Tax=Pseudomassariella vexata TaxID=1141098 RepID=A0A1Y2EIJ3_9PEZI|nr:uncharacterized protein BCR38DRAFT_416713 [Pseudomassariella vexata]ORY71401.1 hypothetical protein BCR38DRAFT_416713 [Pseudomassariella vexata]
MFSALSSYIYLPALVFLALMNLTVTSYLLVAGRALAFMGDMAGQSETRPVYMVIFILMAGANLCMVLVRNYVGSLC